MTYRMLGENDIVHASPTVFDDTTPVVNRPVQIELEPETIVHPYAHFNPRWIIDTRVDGAILMQGPEHVFDVMFDIDDVLCPTIDSIHQLAFEAGLHDGTIEPAWDGAGQYGCDPQAYWDLWSVFAANGGYVNTPPIEEAAEALRRLYWAGHRIHLVTARGFMAHATEIRQWTPEWLENFALPWHTLTFAQDKVAAMSEILIDFATPNKIHAEIYGDAMRETFDLRFDYAIDDRAKTIDALRAVGVDAYLLTHSHNREDHSEHRVGTVTEFVDLILEETA
jgi:hypothetical protein